MIHDYESWGRIDYGRHRPVLLEAYSGTDIVQWQGKIERQLVNMLKEAEQGHNYPYADKLRSFLEVWRANEIGGSINREPIETLSAAAQMLSVDNWKFSDYFSTLRSNLSTLLASEEQLPRGVEQNDNDPFAGGTGGRGGPPMSPEFGPEEEPPSDLGTDTPEPSDIEGEGDTGAPEPGPEGGPSGPDDTEDTGELI